MFETFMTLFLWAMAGYLVLAFFRGARQTRGNDLAVRRMISTRNAGSAFRRRR